LATTSDNITEYGALKKKEKEKKTKPLLPLLFFPRVVIFPKLHIHV
jgi:hypothetical protein